MAQLTTQRQFDRLLEMLLLRQLDRKDPAKVREYRLQVKSRLYRFNYVGFESQLVTQGRKLTRRKCSRP